MTQLTANAVCALSENVVARKIEGEVVIIPLVAGVGDLEDELYTLNPTGQAIWQNLDGQRTLRDVVALLANEFDARLADLESDVIGFASEMVRRGILTIKL